MKLPNHDHAIVPQPKITGYLLSLTHRNGRSKAAFFMHFGFTSEAWEELAAALLHHTAEHEVAKVEQSPFGTRYVIEGSLRAADGRKPEVRSVWFIRSGE